VSAGGSQGRGGSHHLQHPLQGKDMCLPGAARGGEVSAGGSQGRGGVCRGQPGEGREGREGREGGRKKKQ